MKMKNHDYAALKHALNTALILNQKAIDELRPKVSAEYLRWFLFWQVSNADGILKQLYTYLNDNHIDTALRRYFCETEGFESSSIVTTRGIK